MYLECKFKQLHNKYLLLRMITKLEKIKQRSLRSGFTEVYIKSVGKHIRRLTLDFNPDSTSCEPTERVRYDSALHQLLINQKSHRSTLSVSLPLSPAEYANQLYQGQGGEEVILCKKLTMMDYQTVCTVLQVEDDLQNIRKTSANLSKEELEFIKLQKKFNELLVERRHRVTKKNSKILHERKNEFLPLTEPEPGEEGDQAEKQKDKQQLSPGKEICDQYFNLLIPPPQSENFYENIKALVLGYFITILIFSQFIVTEI